MNQYLKKLEAGTKLPLRDHTVDMKEWLRMLHHHYHVWEKVAEAVKVLVLFFI